jgi:hypothetical protein
MDLEKSPNWGGAMAVTEVFCGNRGRTQHPGKPAGNDITIGMMTNIS